MRPQRCLWRCINDVTEVEQRTGFSYLGAYLERIQITSHYCLEVTVSEYVFITVDYCTNGCTYNK